MPKFKLPFVQLYKTNRLKYRRKPACGDFPLTKSPEAKKKVTKEQKFLSDRNFIEVCYMLYSKSAGDFGFTKKISHFKRLGFKGLE